MNEIRTRLTAAVAAAASSSSSSHIRRMRVTSNNSTRVMNAFTQTQAFLVVHVNRSLLWIDQQQHDAYNTPDVTLLLTFPLSFQYMFSDMNLQSLGNNLVLLNSFIPRNFWEEFTGNLSSGIKGLADFAIATKLRQVALRVVVDVVRTEPYDEERYLQHISNLQSLRQFDPSTFGDDQSNYKVMPASRDSIDALETTTFKRSVPSGNGGDEEMVDMSCSICLNEYSYGEKTTKMPCTHCFHSECIKGWLEERSNTCPLCRFQLPVAS